MLPKAGYIQKSRMATIDQDGVPVEVFELMVEGRYYAIRCDELQYAVRGRFPARIESVRQNWKQYITGAVGSLTLSSSGKALNLEFSNGSRFTVSLSSILAVLFRQSSYAPVAKLPIASTIRMQYQPLHPTQRCLASV